MNRIWASIASRALYPAGLAVIALLSACSTTAGLSRSNDWLIVPGARVGPIRAGTSENVLKQVFGEGSVSSGPVDDVYGRHLGTIVFADTPNEVRVVWKDIGRTAPKSVRVNREGGAWHTANGIKVGTKLSELVKLNRGNFTLFGVKDQEGVVRSWEGGALSSNTSPKKLLVIVRDLVAEEPAQALLELGVFRAEGQSDDFVVTELVVPFYEVDGSIGISGPD